MVDLKGCPFCGGEAHYKGVTQRVECSRCWATSLYYYHEKDAVTAWNTRTITLSPAEEKELVEVMAKVIHEAGRNPDIGHKWDSAREDSKWLHRKKAKAALTAALACINGRKG